MSLSSDLLCFTFARTARRFWFCSSRSTYATSRFRVSLLRRKENARKLVIRSFRCSRWVFSDQVST